MGLMETIIFWVVASLLAVAAVIPLALRLFSRPTQTPFRTRWKRWSIGVMIVIYCIAIPVVIFDYYTDTQPKLHEIEQAYANMKNVPQGDSVDKIMLAEDFDFDSETYSLYIVAGNYNEHAFEGKLKVKIYYKDRLYTEAEIPIAHMKPGFRGPLEDSIDSKLTGGFQREKIHVKFELQGDFVNG